MQIIITQDCAAFLERKSHDSWMVAALKEEIEILDLLRYFPKIFLDLRCNNQGIQILKIWLKEGAWRPSKSVFKEEIEISEGDRGRQAREFEFQKQRAEFRKKRGTFRISKRQASAEKKFYHPTRVAKSRIQQGIETSDCS